MRNWREDKFGLVVALGLALLFAAAAGCAPSLEQRRATALSAMTALQASRFDQASTQARKIIEEDGGNPYARLVSAITGYKKTLHQLFIDVQTVLAGAMQTRSLNTLYMEDAISRADKGLEAADEDLAAAEEEPEVTFDLCLACLEVDWNRNGRVDDRDRRLLEVEYDADGKEIPQGDPRRRPEFRFDHGDILWARAFIAFQRAALDFVRAYDWSTLMDSVMGVLAAALGGDDLSRHEIRIALARPERIAQMKKQILKGLDYADRARLAYLDETDDEREWLPNPDQKDHPLPLPVDSMLYDTWELVVGDVRRLVRGQEGLNVAELAQLGDHQWRHPPRGYIDVGKILDQPRDIVIQLGDLDSLDQMRQDEDTNRVEQALSSFFGDYYVMEKPRSPLLTRMARMKSEIDTGKESLERKLRYLLWVN